MPCHNDQHSSTVLNMAATSVKNPTAKQGKAERTERENTEGSLTRSFVLSAKVSEEINKRAESEDRSASKIVDRALAAHFNLS